MIKTFKIATALGFVLTGAANAAPDGYFFGADLSFANEMKDCGAKFADGGKTKDLFDIFHDHGGNIARIRIWNNPDWTKYSSLKDVIESLQRAKAAGLKTLLDFHYSDDWADGGKQVIPAAWTKLGSVEAEAKAVHDFTLETLQALGKAGVLPDMVQVGNETNGEIMRPTEDTPNDPINWKRNAALLNAGIKAVREAGMDAGQDIGVMLHIAQPENVEPWFDNALRSGVTDFDYVGVSYYRKWSSESFTGLAQTIRRAAQKYDAEVILVETAYPWTMKAGDSSTNVLGEDTLLAAYEATPESQRRYMLDISQLVISNGGMGVVYWAPEWVSTKCKTRWGTGSSWENASFFSYGNPHEALPVFDFMGHAYAYPTEISFVLPKGADTEALYLEADFLEDGIKGTFRPAAAGPAYSVRLMPGQVIHYRLRLVNEAPGEPLAPMQEAVVGVSPMKIRFNP